MLDVRGTPRWQVEQYLRQLGGECGSDGTFHGPEWQAVLEESTHVAFGAAVPRVIVRFDGDLSTIIRLEQRLRLCVTRVGG